jgi:hypothetical protein
MKQLSKTNGERGSALLIVFVMAAAIAIMLYMEMPISVFEAQRNKEQLLIDRGNEYAHAVKLYRRKVGQYPPSLDALENTNRMRFLRKRYKDPFTGKDDWRLLHAAPNGILTDSKASPISNSNIAGVGNSNPNTNNQSAGNSSPFGGSNSPFSTSSSSSSSGFSGFSTSSSSSSASSTGEVVVPALPQRRPAVDASNAGGQETPAVADNGFLNTGSLLPAPSGNADPNAPQTPANGQTPGTNGTDPNHLPAANQSSAANTQGASPFRLTPSNSGFGSSSRLGVMQGGGGLGIAGVASIAKGHSIKTVNDQEDYSLWEFYYDPSKDQMRAAAGALSQMGGGQSGGVGQPSNSATNTSGFNSFGGGSNGQQNSFNSSFGNNSFGQRSNTNSSFGSFGNSGTNTSSSFGNSSPPTSNSTPANPPPQQ